MSYKKLVIVLSACILVIALGFFAFIKYEQRTLQNFGEDLGNVPVSIPVENSEKDEKVLPISQKNTSQVNLMELPGCKAAFAPEVYPAHIKLSTQSKNFIHEYRIKWQNVCAGTSDRSLYPLWILVGELTNLDELHDFPEDQQEFFSGIFPTFVPGLTGLYAEGFLLDFDSSSTFFADNILLGNQEDKDFFTAFAPLELDNEFAPWVEQTWDYGGCTKYGKYNWIQSLKTLDELSSKVHSPGYVNALNSSRKSILAHLANDNKIVDKTYSIVDTSICTCDKKEAVAEDLDKVLTYIQGKAQYTDSISFVKNTIEQIKNKKIEILSQSERHCSGG